jgi:hypothetical protein
MPLNTNPLHALNVDVDSLPHGDANLWHLPADAISKDDLLRAALVGRVSQHVYDLTGAHHGIREKVAGYPGEFLARVDGLFDSASRLSAHVAAQIVSGESATFISECIHFCPKLAPDTYAEASTYVRSLREYPALRTREDITTGEAERQSVAIMSVTRIIHEKTAPSFFPNPSHPLEYRKTSRGEEMKLIKELRLVNYIASHPEMSAAVGNVVARYGFTEPASVVALIGGIIPAVAEGALWR